jgi:hypothetical protein
MKINEVTDKQLDEGILDKAKQAYQGVKGFVQGGVGGAKAGWSQQGAKNAQQGLDNKVAQGAGQTWAKVAQQIQTSTGKPPTTMQAHDWLKQFMGGVEPMSAPPNANPATIYKWLQKEVANYSAKKQMGQPNAAQPAQGAQAQQGQQPAQNQQQPNATSTKPPGGFKATVVTDTGEYAFKYADNIWRYSDGRQITAPNEVKDLEQKFTDAKAKARARGKVDPKQYDTAEQQLIQAMDAAQRMTKEQLLQFKQHLQAA